MPRYWAIAPYASKASDLYDAVWKFDLARGVISIGWSKLGDISAMNRVELASHVAAVFPDDPPATRSLVSNMLWAFYHEVKPGDIVLARRGRKALAGVGTVTRAAYFAPGKNPTLSSAERSHQNFLDIAWNDSPRDKVYDDLVFPMHTVWEIDEGVFRSLTGLTEVPTPGDLAPQIEDQKEFVLEKYLEDFIVANFASIFKGKLLMYRDAEEADGQQYDTDIGRIDILAVEPASNSLVVIELKKGRPSDQVVGQVLRYMGWVQEKLCKEGQGVKGLVICHDRDTQLSYALRMVKDVDIRYYRVSFTLNEAP